MPCLAISVRIFRAAVSVISIMRIKTINRRARKDRRVLQMKTLGVFCVLSGKTWLPLLRRGQCVRLDLSRRDSLLLFVIADCRLNSVFGEHRAVNLDRREAQLVD